MIVKYSPDKYKMREHIHCKSILYGIKDQEIKVMLWARWPSYDFIFGFPTVKNKYEKWERGFFQYRDSRKGHKGACFYVDLGELKVLVEGFTKLLRRAAGKKAE